MRVLVDTNLFIAYLLKPHGDSFITLLFSAISAGEVTLLTPEMLLEEIERVAKHKPNLTKLISEERLEQFLRQLRLLGEAIPPITEPIPPIVRDVKDDYLIAYAVVGRADYLVSGDKDLLVLNAVASVSIVNSGQFRQILDAQRIRNSHAN